MPVASCDSKFDSNRFDILLQKLDSNRFEEFLIRSNTMGVSVFIASSQNLVLNHQSCPHGGVAFVNRVGFASGDKMNVGKYTFLVTGKD